MKTNKKKKTGGAKKNKATLPQPRKIGKKILPLIFGIILMLSVLGILADVVISPILPILGGGNFNTSNSSVEINYNISTDYMNNATLSSNFSGSQNNITLIDGSTVFMSNTNNNSAVGDNATNLVNIAQYNYNGTINGSNITWTPNGVNGLGAYAFNGSAYINFTTLTADKAFSNNNITFSFWINNNATTQWNYIMKLESTASAEGGNGIYLRTGASSPWNGLELVVGNCGASYNQIVTGNGVVPQGTWTNIVVTINSTQSVIYKNGVFLTNSTIGNKCFNKTGTPLTLSTGGASAFNGSISQVIVDNGSLWTPTRILNNYKSQLTKYNATSWSYDSNQTLGSISSLNYSNQNATYNDYLCSSNLTASVCTVQQIITQILPVVNVTANFTNYIRTIPMGFYGVGTDYGFFTGSSWITLDTNFNGVPTTVVNHTYYWNLVNNANIDNLRLYIDLGTNYANTTDPSGVNRTSNYSSYLNIVRMAHQYNKVVIFQIRDIPTWLIDNSSGKCYTAYSANCTALNYTKYANIISDAEGYITDSFSNEANFQYEFYNEPESNWNVTIYITHLNNTVTALNLLPNNIKLIAPATELNYPGFVNANWNFMKYVMGNVSGFYPSFHAYPQTFLTNDLSNDIINITANCGLADCSKIFLSEGNTFNITAKNTSTLYGLYGASTGNGFLTALNSQNFSLLSTYQLASQYSYLHHATDSYPEYPQDWAITSDPLLDNQISIAYNVTSNVAHLCQSNSSVYTSTTDNSTLSVVSCNKGNSYDAIIINTDVNSKNVSLNQFPLTQLYDLTTGLPLSTSLNVIMDSYQNGSSNNIMYIGNGVYGTNQFDNSNSFWNKHSLLIQETDTPTSTVFTNTNTINDGIDIYGLTSPEFVYDNGTVLNVNGLNQNVNVTLVSGQYVTLYDQHPVYSAPCTSGVNGVNALILIIVVLLPIITCIWLIAKREDLDMQKLMYGFLILIIELALAGIVANSVITICT